MRVLLTERRENAAAMYTCATYIASEIKNSAVYTIAPNGQRIRVAAIKCISLICGTLANDGSMTKIEARNGVWVKPCSCHYRRLSLMANPCCHEYLELNSRTGVEWVSLNIIGRLPRRNKTSEDVLQTSDTKVRMQVVQFQNSK
jgi:hypothetical protein